MSGLAVKFYLAKKMQITTEINERFMIYESGQVAHY